MAADQRVWPASILAEIADALGACADRSVVLRSRLVNRVFSSAGADAVFRSLTLESDGKALRADGFDEIIASVGQHVQHLDVHGLSAAGSSGGDGDAHKVLLRHVATAILACDELRTLVVDAEIPALIALGARTFESLHSLTLVAVLPRTVAHHETVRLVVVASLIA